VGALDNPGQTRLNLSSHLKCHPPKKIKFKTSKLYF